VAIRISCAGGALCACLALAGCVTEPGKTGPALWTTVDTQSDEPDVRLKNPVRLHASYGRMAEANGRRTVARKHYESALSHDPKCVDAIVGIARLDQFAGQTRRAEAGFRKAVALAPRNPDVLRSAGLYYSSQGRWREAVASLNAAVAAAPNVAKHRYALAVVLAKSGDINAAMPQFIATVGRAEAHSQIARYLLERGDRNAAEQQVRIALSLQPSLDSARRMLPQLHNADAARGMAAAEPQRRPVRAVSHVGPANGLGSQTAWRRDVPPQSGQRPYANEPLRSQPNEGRYDQPQYGQSLQIVPGTSRPQRGAPTIQPIGHDRDDRFRRPTPIDDRGYDDPSSRSIPQWNPNGRNE
jgi:tetratricopeptide (TPR) repeat protein